MVHVKLIVVVCAIVVMDNHVENYFVIFKMIIIYYTVLMLNILFLYITCNDVFQMFKKSQMY